eukprot:1031641-Amphidinium_carterae.1
MKAPPSARASSRGKTQLPADKRDGSKVKYDSKYKNADFKNFEFNLIPACAIKFRKEANTYFGEIQPN